MATLDRRLVILEQRADIGRDDRLISDLYRDIEICCVAMINDPNLDPVEQQRAFDMLAEHDLKEAKLKEYETRPEHLAAVADNLTAGRTYSVDFPEGVRWPYLIHRALWWEAYSTRKVAA